MSVSVSLFDTSRPEHRKALGKLERDLILWFVTTAADGRPHAVPVWFFWHEGRVLVFTRGGSVKAQHVRAGSPVLVHLEGGRFGDDVVVLGGAAEVSERSAADWLAEFREAYEAKYAEAIADYGAPLDAVVEQFETALVFTPERVMAW